MSDVLLFREEKEWYASVMQGWFSEIKVAVDEVVRHAEAGGKPKKAQQMAEAMAKMIQNAVDEKERQLVTYASAQSMAYAVAIHFYRWTGNVAITRDTDFYYSGVTNMLDDLTRVPQVEGTRFSALLPIRECRGLDCLRSFSEREVTAAAGDHSIATHGCLFHVGQGLFIKATDHAEMMLQVMMTDEGEVERSLVIDVISSIWPSTTQATYVSPKGVGSDESPFHKERLILAEKYMAYLFGARPVAPGKIKSALMAVFNQWFEVYRLEFRKRTLKSGLWMVCYTKRAEGIDVEANLEVADIYRRAVTGDEVDLGREIDNCWFVVRDDEGYDQLNIASLDHISVSDSSEHPPQNNSSNSSNVDQSAGIDENEPFDTASFNGDDLLDVENEGRTVENENRSEEQDNGLQNPTDNQPNEGRTVENENRSEEQANGIQNPTDEQPTVDSDEQQTMDLGDIERGSPEDENMVTVDDGYNENLDPRDFGIRMEEDDVKPNVHSDDDEIQFVAQVKLEPGEVAISGRRSLKDEKIKCSQAARKVVSTLEAELQRERAVIYPDSERIKDLEEKLLQALANLAEMSKHLK